MYPATSYQHSKVGMHMLACTGLEFSVLLIFSCNARVGVLTPKAWMVFKFHCLCVLWWTGVPLVLRANDEIRILAHPLCPITALTIVYGCIIRKPIINDASINFTPCHHTYTPTNCNSIPCDTGGPPLP
jgi:hypothetical protein